jgi:hypothetical protein
VVGDLPLITANPCSSIASSLAGAGLGTVCQVTTGVTHAASSIASSAVGFGANSVLNALGSWVSDGASWLLAQIGKVIADTTTIDLGASWFTDHYQIMAVLSGAVIMPMLLMGIMQSIYRQNSSTLIRSVLVNVPLALLLTAVAVKLVQLGLALTDDMSSAISQGAGLNSGHFLASVAKGLSNSSANGQPTAPAFVVFVGGLVVVFGALMVWVELLIRAAAVYVAVLFLPLALASLAWPAIAHWCRRLVDTLVALVLGKFVIVAVLSLAAGALAGGSQGGSAGGGFAAVLAGAALLLFAAFAPWALFRLLPFLEAGAVGHLESLSHRAHQTASAPAKSLAHTAMGVAGAGLFHARGGGGDLLKGALGAGAGTGKGGLSGLGGAGSGPGSGGGAGSDDPTSGGGGSPGTGPDSGPSSAESTGVGTMESPGAGIPMWTPNPSATAIANRGSAPEGTGPENAGARNAGAASMGAASTGHGDGNRPLPQQTGALVSDSLGRDAIGVRLISRPISPSGSGSAPSVRPPSWTPFPPQDPGVLERGDGGDVGGF